MDRRIIAVLGFPLLVTSALAQGFPIPSPEEIDRRVGEAIEALPSVEAQRNERAEEVGLRLTCKEVPTDPVEIVKRFGGLPAGPQLDAMVKQFLPQALPFLAKHLRAIGKLETSVGLKIGRKELPAGEYTFGLVLAEDQYQPVGLLLSRDDLEAPVVIDIETRRCSDSYDVLTLVLDASKKDFRILVAWAQTGSKTDKIKLVKD